MQTTLGCRSFVVHFFRALGPLRLRRAPRGGMSCFSVRRLAVVGSEQGPACENLKRDIGSLNQLVGNVAAVAEIIDIEAFIARANADEKIGINDFKELAGGVNADVLAPADRARVLAALAARVSQLVKNDIQPASNRGPPDSNVDFQEVAS
eukprot:1932443-Pyramimonas_sp.AAC.1